MNQSDAQMFEELSSVGGRVLGMLSLQGSADVEKNKGSLIESSFFT